MARKRTENGDDDLYRVKAGATKELFIYMLVRDLVLRDAIGDLVDNSVDAVRRVVNTSAEEPSEFALTSDKYKGYYLTLTFDGSQFVIEDNCGGMEAETAREYAFRFGRDPSAPPTPGSIGQFGIGMKRALFKLGRHFHITSKAANSSFELTIDVDKWLESPDWDFRFDDYSERPTLQAEARGMRIVVTRLNPDVSDILGSGASNLFESRLNKEIGNENLFNINNGFIIKINNNRLRPRQLEILTAPEFKAGSFTQTYYEYDERGQRAAVEVRIITGIGESKLSDGGWYIFCNERLIVGPNQDSISGWIGQGSGTPKYHGQYERFRGYVFLSSDNAAVLPWNTTKTSMDMDSKLYISVRQEMIRMMGPVITFLNDMKKEREKDNPIENRPLEAAVARARLAPILTVATEQQAPQFVAPRPSPVTPLVAKQLIRYYTDMERFELVKKSLRASRKDDVGPMVFDYYYRNEVE